MSREVSIPKTIWWYSMDNRVVVKLRYIVILVLLWSYIVQGRQTLSYIRTLTQNSYQLLSTEYSSRDVVHTKAVVKYYTIF